MCNIDGETSDFFTKNTWIGDSGASCRSTNNDTHLFLMTETDQSMQGSFGIMLSTKKGKVFVSIQLADGAKQNHTLWPVMFCLKASTNLFFLTCELLQGSKI